MKTSKDNGPTPYLQKRNNSWKWLAGATSAAAAGVSASQASLITINLTNNYISATGGNHLNADLTGDGHPDLTLTGAKYSYARVIPYPYTRSVYDYVRFQAVRINGVLASDYSVRGYNPSHHLNLSGHTTLRSYRSSATYLKGSIPIFFKDLHINSGAPTNGFVTVTEEGSVIQLNSFTYASNTPVAGSRVAAVPDQGSSLALLAMGAGGVLALRRWKAAQTRF